MSEQWKRLGIGPDQHELLIKNIRKSRSNEVFDPKRRILDGAYQSAVTSRAKLSILGALDFKRPEDGLQDWVQLAKEICALSVTYFFGAWRNGFVRLNWEGPLSERQCREKLTWLEVFDFGLLWSLILSNHETRQKLVSWPDVDLPFDEGFRERNKADNAYRILLAKWLRGDQIVRDENDEALSVRGGRRAKGLFATLRAIAKSDASGASKCLVDYLSEFRRREFDTARPELSISIEGSTLWHIAKNQELELHLPCTERDLILLADGISMKS